MFDTSKTYFFGVATDEPSPSKEPKRPHFAIGDLVYYYPPGDRYGKMVTVTGYTYDENGNILVNIKQVVSGELFTWTVPASQIRV